MEQDNQRKNNRILFLIIKIFAFIIFALVFANVAEIISFRNYDNNINSDYSNNYDEDKNDSIDNENISNNIEKYLINGQYAILDVDYNNNGNDINTYGNIYLIKLNGKNSFDSILYLGNDVNIIGLYNNRIYYSYYVYQSDKHNVYIKYISLDNDNPTEETWLEIPQPNCPKGLIGCGANEFHHSVIVDDTLYFNFGSFSGGVGEYDGLMSLNMNAKTFDEYKSIEKKADVLQGWCINNNNIYYFENYKKLVEHNIISNAKKTLLEFGNEKTFQYMTCENNNMLYNIYDYGQQNNELYLYDMNNNSNVLITDDAGDDSGGMRSIANIIDGNIYYKNANKIYLYDKKSKTSSIYYNPDNYNSIYEFYFLNKNIMKIKYREIQNPQYVINGKLVSSIDTISVKMKEGNTETYTIDLLR